MKILIVEDETLIALATKLQLEKHGFTVTGMVRDTISFWENINSITPDIILMDMKLKHDESGIEIARAFRKTNELVPIIFTTGNSEKLSKEETHDITNSSILYKPLNYQQIIFSLTEYQKNRTNV